MNKIDVLSKLSLEMRKVVDFQKQNADEAFDTDGLSYSKIRKNYELERKFWNENGPHMFKIEENFITIESKKIKTRIYTPEKCFNKFTIFFIHGGGFIVGSVDTHDRIMKLLAEKSCCKIIGIDYSLSPETKFPSSIKECVEVVKYYKTNASKFNLNKNFIFAGDSSGAHLSLATFLWLRDKEKNFDLKQIKGLLLYYGIYGLKDSQSRRLYGGSWDGLTQKDIELFYELYLENKKDFESPYCCLFNNDLIKNMPPCFIAACEFDPLLDDSSTLYSILKENNIRSQYKICKGTLHAFLHYSKMTKVADDALEDGVNFLKKLIFNI